MSMTVDLPIKESNTLISYLYRDADNYKVRNEAVVSGTLTPAQVNEIFSACDEEMYFIPSQVGLDGERFSEETEADHPWFELTGIEITDRKPTTDMTADDLYRNFAEMKGKWNELEDIGEER